MLRIYSKYDRTLLSGLCRCAYKSLLTFLREVVGLKEGVPGAVMAIHTFGSDPAKWHPHLHVLRKKEKNAKSICAKSTSW